MKRTATLLAILILVSPTLNAQTRKNNKLNLTKAYWLKYSLVFYEGHTPRIFPNNIVFTQGAPPRDARNGGIKGRGTKIKIHSVKEEMSFVSVKFRHWPEIFEQETEYEVLLKGDSKRSFQNAFKLLFSDSRVSAEYDCPGAVATRKQAIQCLGFPMIVTTDGNVEQFHYILEFIGPNPFSGFDGFTLEIKNNKVIDVSGYI